MKRFLIGIAIIGFLLLAFTPLSWGLMWFFYGGPKWPKITEPTKLRHEATSLVLAGYAGAVPREAWPEGIAALEPRMVFADSQSVDVMISAGGISALPWGYIIWPDTVSRTDGASRNMTPLAIRSSHVRAKVAMHAKRKHSSPGVLCALCASLKPSLLDSKDLR